MPVPSSQSLEKQIISQLADVAKRIAELTEEQRTLQRILEGVRRRTIPNLDVTRKNSHQRIIVEDAIMRSFASTPGRRTVASLHLDVRLTLPEIKPSTFRTYLHRMARRGLLRPDGERGGWSLVGPSDSNYGPVMPSDTAPASGQ